MPFWTKKPTHKVRRKIVTEVPKPGPKPEPKQDIRVMQQVVGRNERIRRMLEELQDATPKEK